MGRGMRVERACGELADSICGKRSRFMRGFLVERALLSLVKESYALSRENVQLKA